MKGCCGEGGAGGCLACSLTLDPVFLHAVPGTGTGMSGGHFFTALITVAASPLPTAAAAANNNWTFVGAGGCDVSDAQCQKPSLPYSHQIVALHGTAAKINTTTAGSPSWLHINAERTCLFAALTDASKVASYEILDGKLVGPKSVVDSGGKFPVKLDSVRSFVIVANYGASTEGASVGSLVVGDECKCCLKLADSMPFNRSSVDPHRQLSSHIHTVVVDGANVAREDARVYAADLGGDAIYRLSVHLKGSPPGALTLEETAAVVPAGSGPRHLAVGGPSNRRMVYVVHEMANAVSVHSTETGKLVEVQRVSTLPSNASVPSCVGLSDLDGTAQTDSSEGAADPPSQCNKAAEIALTHDGRHLFVSNRGYGTALTNTIASYSIGDGGKLVGGDLSMLTPSGVSYPRGMALVTAPVQTKVVERLLVAGQGSGNLVAFELAEGKLRRPETLATGLATPTTVVGLCDVRTSSAYCGPL